MKIIKLITSIVTLIIYVACISLSACYFILEQWEPAIITLVFSCVFGYFSYHDFKAQEKNKVVINES
jgi:CHASE2 domain-containing sensor protein